MNKLIIVRHGKTDWNEKKLLQGATDIELNKEGILEVTKLKEKINLKDIDICISSPLKRARKTAELLTNGEIKIVYDDMLMERGFGNFEGKPVNFDLIGIQWDYNINYSENGVESIKKLLRRAKKFIKKIKANYSNKTILIVSHGSFIKALHFCLIGYDKNTDFLSFSPKNAEIYEYIIEQ